MRPAEFIKEFIDGAFHVLAIIHGHDRLFGFQNSFCDQIGARDSSRDHMTIKDAGLLKHQAHDLRILRAHPHCRF